MSRVEARYRCGDSQSRLLQVIDRLSVHRGLVRRISSLRTDPSIVDVGKMESGWPGNRRPRRSAQALELMLEAFLGVPLDVDDRSAAVMYLAGDKDEPVAGEEIASVATEPDLAEARGWLLDHLPLKYGGKICVRGP